MKFLKLFAIVTLMAFVLVSCDSGKDSQDNTVREPSVEVGETAESLTTAETEDIVLIAFLNSRAINQMTDMIAENNQLQNIEHFNQQMEQDHKKIVLLMGELADKLNIELPEALTPSQLEEVSKFMELDQQQFNQQYLDYLISEHQESISELKKLEQHAEFAIVEGTIGEAVAILEEHLNQLQDSTNTMS